MNELVADAVFHASVVGQLRRCSERQCLIIDRCSDRRGRQQNDNDEHHSSRGCSFALLNFKKYLLQIACISVISLRRLELQLAVLRWSKRQLTILARLDITQRNVATLVFVVRLDITQCNVATLVFVV